MIMMPAGSDIGNLKEESVTSLSRAFKDDTAIGFNDVDGPGVEIEQTDVEAATKFTPHLFDEVAQFISFSGGQLVLSSTRVAAATWNERKEAEAWHLVVDAKSNHPADDAQAPGDNGRLHRHGYSRGEQAIDGSGCFVESSTPDDLVMMGLISVQTYFDLSSGRAKVGNKVIGQSNAIGRQSGFPTLGTDIVDQFRESMMNRWLSAAEVNCFYSVSQQPINSSFEY